MSKQDGAERLLQTVCSTGGQQREEEMTQTLQEYRGLEGPTSSFIILGCSLHPVELGNFSHILRGQVVPGMEQGWLRALASHPYASLLGSSHRC